MKCIIVYGRGLDANDHQLYLACKRLVGDVSLIRVSDLSAYVGSDGVRFWRGSREVTGVELCFLRSLGSGGLEKMMARVGVLECMKAHGAAVINSAYALLNAKNKFYSSARLAEAGLPVPKTYLTESAHWAYRATQGLRCTVYKPLLGSMGFGSMKFEDADMAFNAYRRLEELGQPLYVQEYVEAARDLRVMVVDGDVIASMERVPPKGEWRANVARGGAVKPARISEDIEEASIRAAEALNLFYAGVDVLETREGPVLLEVNGSPHWQGLREATGVDVAGRLVEAAIRRIKR